MADVTELRSRLRDGLRSALSASDRMAVGALRSAIAAIDNAEAVAAGDRSTSTDGVIAGAAAGVAATDVPRRELTEAEARAVVRAEVEDRQAAAAEFDRLGRHEQGSRLRAEAELLDEVLAD